jgi:biotin carboxyl carrier protein
VPERSPADRTADHAVIDRLRSELLPALIAKLGATGLGELEVREGAWRVRLRRPARSPSIGQERERRPGDRDRSARSSSHAGARPAVLTPVGPGRDDFNGSDRAGRDGGPVVATSPAVGIFQPRSETGAGAKVRAGDRLGTVDMLGIPQEVVAPSDGVVGATLVEPGDAVEYGQELILIEFATTSPVEG